MRLLKGEGGFALSELLVIIAILGVIAAIVVPNIIGGAQIEEGQEYIDTARAIAEEIPLPAWYCPVHGVRGEPEEIEVELVGYNTSTGEPLLEITCKVLCPEIGFWSWHTSEHIHRFYLYIKSGGGLYYDLNPQIPLSKLTDDTVEKIWR